MKQALTGIAFILAAASLAAAADRGSDKERKPAPSDAATLAASQKSVYSVVNTIKIGGVGSWSSITLDVAGKYLYIPREKHTDVIDTATGKVTEIPTPSAVAVALVPTVNRGFITNSQQGTVTVFDLKTNAVLGDFAVGAQPSGIIYDPASKRLLVQCGDSSLVPCSPDIDLKTGKPEAAITFQGKIGDLVADDFGMVYVTLMDKNEIAVLDTRTMNIATQWSSGDWPTPKAITMDRIHSRLFISCGGRLKILSASDGHILDNIEMRRDKYWQSGVALYDGHAFSVCGDGTMTILGQKDDGTFVVQNTVELEQNAQPIAIDQNTGKIYLPTDQVENYKHIPDTFKILVLQKK